MAIYDGTSQSTYNEIRCCGTFCTRSLRCSFTLCTPHGYMVYLLREEMVRGTSADVLAVFSLIVWPWTLFLGCDILLYEYICIFKKAESVFSRVYSVCIFLFIRLLIIIITITHVDCFTRSM